MALKYGGKTISDYSAMRGPCPSGFHIPLRSEWVALSGVLVNTLGLASDGSSIKTYLKMPFAGSREWSSSNVVTQDTNGYYWSSTAGNNNSAYYFAFNSTAIFFKNSNRREYGFPIRAFKDFSVVPDNSWTTLYDGSSIASGAGIFHNPANGLISISGDGTTWITIADKNLGATTVYNDGATLSQANCGNYYQRGNNYGFPKSGSVTTSSTQVDASNYGPGNYYSSNTFITFSGGDWSSVKNDNLRGGVTGVKQNPVDIVERYYGGKTINDYSAMRGPCPSGYHIATLSERQSLMWTGSHLGAWNINGRGDDVKLYLKIPFAGIRFPQNGDTTYNGTNWQGYSANLWTSTGPSTSDDTARSFQITASSVRLDAISVRSAGYSVRPFKDVPVAPDSSWTTLYDGSSVAIGAGVFHNSTLGLISISGDGTTWTTIADKNLGATIIYSNGDTLSQANCGNFYQWGNCYGFPFSGNVTTSGTQVDASTYGPRNYYTSSTFITRNSGSFDWSSVKNDNLWGGVAGIKQHLAKVIEVYYNTTKIRPFYPAGIYWNPNIDGGIISLSANGTDWITISDKNLGATTVYNLGDTLNQSNCGNFYQRGNNYGFPYTGTPSRTSTKVNVSSYGPNNYYSSSTFVRVNYNGNRWTDASISASYDLWGGETDTIEAMKGPCPNGFHIPSYNDGLTVFSIYRDLNILSQENSQSYLKLPLMGIRDNYSASVSDSGTTGGFWCTKLNPNPTDGTYYPYELLCWSGSQYKIQISTGYMNSHCLGIRPFRNTAIIPDDGWTKIL